MSSHQYHSQYVAMRLVLELSKGVMKMVPVEGSRYLSENRDINRAMDS